jgi:acyl-CoA thioester hydrolase
MPYLWRVSVRPEDADYLGHVSNVVYVRWVQDSALAHSTAAGLDERAYLARGQSWVVRRHEIEYLRAAVPGDEVVVETRVASMGAASSVRLTRIFRNGDLLARASTNWAFLDLARMRPTRIPEDIRARFALEPDEPELLANDAGRSPRR